jgi:Ca-activated chloride channel family protein
MRALLLAVLLGWAATAQAGLDWSHLWQTPDQRGDQLLKQGKPGEAAGVYRDPRRKAYAELLAGDYAHAARDFAPFDDSDSLYNRGNALARAGDLQAALKAYDAALARNPDDRDARHNRDLVAEALKRQPPKPQSSSGGDKQGNPQQNGGKQVQSGAGDSGQQAKNSGQQNGSGQQNQSGRKSASNPSGSNDNRPDQNHPGQNPTGQDKTGAGQTPQAQAQPAQGKQANAAQPAQAGQAAQAAATDRNPVAKDSAAEARADAEAALHGQPNGVAVADAPLSERQLAQQEWLRRIPDDPGGLLRRKFMIEHMLRQQGGQP